MTDQQIDNLKLKALQSFRLFNEKADKLRGMSFTKQLIAADSGFTLKYNKGAEVIQAVRHGPNDESIEAFVLTFRFFVQNNEVISINKMEKLYGKLREAGLLQKQLVEDFNEAREALNRYLDEEPNINFTYIERSFTRRQILDTFVYGGLAHANANKKALYDEWKQIPFIFPMLENEFVSSLMTVLAVIAHIANINEKAIKELKGR